MIRMPSSLMNASGNWTGAINFGSIGDDGINAITLHPSGDVFVGRILLFWNSWRRL